MGVHTHTPSQAYETGRNAESGVYFNPYQVSASQGARILRCVLTWWSQKGGFVPTPPTQIIPFPAVQATSRINLPEIKWAHISSHPSSPSAHWTGYCLVILDAEGGQEQLSQTRRMSGFSPAGSFACQELGFLPPFPFMTNVQWNIWCLKTRLLSLAIVNKFFPWSKVPTIAWKTWRDYDNAPCSFFCYSYRENKPHISSILVPDSGKLKSTRKRLNRVKYTWESGVISAQGTIKNFCLYRRIYWRACSWLLYAF